MPNSSTDRQRRLMCPNSWAMTPIISVGGNDRTQLVGMYTLELNALVKALWTCGLSVVKTFALLWTPIFPASASTSGLENGTGLYLRPNMKAPNIVLAKSKKNLDEDRIAVVMSQK